MAAQAQRTILYLEDPVGVGPEQLAIGIDHLGLDPEAEFHAEAPDMRDEWPEPFGILVGVGPPVAEPGPVVVAALKPAVVENEALDPDGGGAVRQVAQPLRIVVK